MNNKLLWAAILFLVLWCLCLSHRMAAVEDTIHWWSVEEVSELHA